MANRKVWKARSHSLQRTREEEIVAWGRLRFKFSVTESIGHRDVTYNIGELVDNIVITLYDDG